MTDSEHPVIPDTKDKISVDLAVEINAISEMVGERIWGLTRKAIEATGTVKDTNTFYIKLAYSGIMDILISELLVTNKQRVFKGIDEVYAEEQKPEDGSTKS